MITEYREFVVECDNCDNQLITKDHLDYASLIQHIERDLHWSHDYESGMLLCPKCWGFEEAEPAPKPEPKPVKPCPFCGGEAKIDTGWNGKKFVCCADDNCKGYWCVHDTEEAAIKAWNMRAELT